MTGIGGVPEPARGARAAGIERASAGPRRIVGLAALALALAVAVSGCGRAELWARDRADREFWKARRSLKRIEIDPALASAYDYDRAIAAFERVTVRFPAQRWTSPERLHDPLARDVALVSGRAMLATARLEELRGSPDKALERYARAARDFAALAPVTIEASLARAALLEREGDWNAATGEWERIGSEHPVVDPATGEVLLAVMDAPLRAARELRERGENPRADSVLVAAERRWLDALRAQPRSRAAAELWWHVAAARRDRGAPGGLDGTLDALRRGLEVTGPGAPAARLLIGLAQYSLEGGRPDSAMVYALWAQAGYGDEARARAMLLEAEIWERDGMLDSALVAYDRFAEAYPGAIEEGLRVRYHRAVILERLGRWEQARSELRALAASHPSHDLGFAAQEQIVAHHMSRGERDLGEIEGRRAIERCELMIATARDPDIQLRARESRARILVLLADYEAGVEALTGIWKDYRQKPAGVRAGFRAAELAERQLKQRWRALDLYRELAAGSGSLDDVRTAREAIARLEIAQDDRR